MFIQKIANTLFKGLLLFILTTSIPNSGSYDLASSYKINKNQNHQSAVSPNTVEVSADSKKPKNELLKNHFASYSCNENSYKLLLSKINELRAENNISKATLDGQLNAVACAHTKWMLQNQKFGHRGQDDTGFESRCIEANTKCTDESILNNIENDFVSMFTKAIGDANTKEKMLDPDNKNIGFAFEQGVLTVIYR
jgi:uncharacterized protein YkwD